MKRPDAPAAALQGQAPGEAGSSARGTGSSALPFRCPEESRTQQPEGRQRPQLHGTCELQTPGPSSPRPALPPTALPFLPVLGCPYPRPAPCPAPSARPAALRSPRPRIPRIPGRGRGTSAGGRVSGSGRPGAPGHGAGPGEGREGGSTAPLSGSASTAETPDPSGRAAPRGWPGPCPAPQHHPTDVSDSRRKMDGFPELAAPGRPLLPPPRLCPPLSAPHRLPSPPRPLLPRRCALPVRGSLPPVAADFAQLPPFLLPSSLSQLPAVRPLSAIGGKEGAHLCTPVSAFADPIGSDLNSINEFFKCHCSRYR